MRTNRAWHRSFVAPEPTRELRRGPVPTFSVVIPVFNAAATVAGAVESALRQTMAPIEVLVVDDGSTDDIDGALAHHRHKIELIRKANGGTSSAFNAGVRAAVGDFVAVLDADDTYESERIEALGELAASRPDLDLVMTDSYFEVDGRIVGRYSVAARFPDRDQRLHILDRCFVGWPAVRRERLIAVGGYDEQFRISHDWDCYLRLILGGSQAGLVDVPLHNYRITEGSLTDHRAEALRERVRVLEKAARSLDLRHEEHAILQRSLAGKRYRMLLAEAEAALRNGDQDARRKTLAVIFGPGMGLRTRLKALVATLAPRWAVRRLEAQEARTGQSRLQRSYPK